MADYTPVNGADLADTVTFTAGAAITGGQVLYFTAADTVSPSAGATQAFAGVAAHDAASGAPVTVFTGAGVIHETPTTALAPPPAPAPTNTGAGGTVAAGLYSVVTAYVNALGESAGSAVGQTTTAGATSQITVPSPPANPAAAGWYAYVTQPNAGVYSRQGTSQTIGVALVISAPPTTGGAAPQAGNTSGPQPGALIAAAAGGAITGGAAPGQELGVAVRGSPAAPAAAPVRWKTTRG